MVVPELSVRVAATRPPVAVVAMGGTIASAQRQAAGVLPSLSAEAVVASVPRLTEAAEVRPVSLQLASSSALRLEDVLRLAAVVHEQLAGGAHGVVVTHGTDTLEETAFALDVLLNAHAPVVVTGAMRDPGMAGPDGPANLLAAVRVAAASNARDAGVLVVANDEVHAARYVRKTHTFSPATFASPTVGPVGWVVEDRVRIALRPVRHGLLVHPGAARSTAVALLTCGLGDDGRLVGIVADAGYTGLVIEGFGGGHVPPWFAEPVTRLAKRIPVVVTSRTGAGETLRSTYASPGCETDLLGRGLLAGGDLDGPKCRILLTLLQRSGASHDDIRAAFDRFVTH